jgi:hypothetical protein
MPQRRLINLLNQLLSLNYCSAVRYIGRADPWTPHDRQGDLTTLHRIGSEQEKLAGEIAKVVLDENGTPDAGDYGLEFAGTHNLSLEYLIDFVIRQHRLDREAMAALRQDLANHPRGHDLAIESIHLADRHLQDLERLARRAESDASTRVD